VHHHHPRHDNVDGHNVDSHDHDPPTHSESDQPPDHRSADHEIADSDTHGRTYEAAIDTSPNGGPDSPDPPELCLALQL
jgi:hypothetical protein